MGRGGEPLRELHRAQARRPHLDREIRRHSAQGRRRREIPDHERYRRDCEAVMSDFVISVLNEKREHAVRWLASSKLHYEGAQQEFDSAHDNYEAAKKRIEQIDAAIRQISGGE